MMNQPSTMNGAPNQNRSTFVIMREGDGFKVYSPDSPNNQYIVSGTFETPVCTCPDFLNYRQVPGYRCPHIMTVFQYPGDATNTPDSYDREERQAIQEESRLAELSRLLSKVNHPPEMNLKRSVSPDGRIDSLSIEFSCPVDLIEPESVKNQAERAMTLQSEIAARFLNDNNPKHNTSGSNGNGDRPGRGDSTDYQIIQLTHIAGSQTKYGWRLFINARVNGQDVRLYGDYAKLSEYLTDAGYPDLGRNIHEGNQINVQCRAALKNDPNKKYPVIERILPLNGSTR